MTLTFTPKHCGIVVLALFLSLSKAIAQCPTVFDFYGVASSQPYWYSCSGGSYSFNLQSPDSWGEYTINWGDGSPIESGTSWVSPQFINHVYAAAVDTFVVTITEVATGCVVSGVVVMEQATSASIQIPVGGLTQACAPQVMEFINSSTNVSETTVFTWDFGDGTAPLVFDHTNWLQTISHLYDVGTVDCETEVRLTAENYCNRVQGGNSEATFNPIRIWDLDDAAITASATLLCYPDTTVTFMNTTERNCFFQGNIYQRYEYWNLGDYWGLGHDSIIDWTPWPPTFPKTIHFPGVGSYTISMLDSNFCGIAPASITVQIVPPPVAGIACDRDTVCIGESITFFQQSTGGANSFEWNFGNGSGWLPTGPGNITFTYTAPGTYTVISRVSVTGSSSGCADTDTLIVTVLRRPELEIIVDDDRGCDSLAVNYSFISNDALQWFWTFETDPFTFNGEYPPTIYYNNPGNYDAYLTVVGGNGCSASDDIRVRVFRSPIANFQVLNVCEGDTAQFVDQSTSPTSNPIVQWTWDFGDGNTSPSPSPEHLFGSIGTYDISLIVRNNNCADTVNQTITIQAATQATIGANITSGCSPLNVQFTNQTTDAVAYYWTFGDGTFSTDSVPSHVFYNTGSQDTTFQVIMTAMNMMGCGGRDTLYITVSPGAIAAFTDNTNPPGCSPFQAVFQNQSVNAVAYSWNFGDGTTSTLTNPQHLYVNTTGVLQTFPVTLIAYSPSGCNDTLTRNVIVYPLADFDFTINNPSGCSPHTVTMPFIAGIQSYQWNFGNGNTSSFPLPTHTYTNTSSSPIDYTITLIGTSAFGCSDTATTTVTVSPGPNAQFVANAVSGCSPLTVQFTNLSQNAIDYAWNYGNGISSDTLASSHDYTFVNNSGQVQTYNVTLTAVSGPSCVSTFSIPIQVFPSINASFQDPGPKCAPANVFFNNTTTGADQFIWDFGNGIQSTEANPSISYINTSDTTQYYTVGLMAYSVHGCQSMVQDTIAIHPSPDAAFTTSETQACSPAPVILTNNSIGASQFQWQYGDGTFSNQQAQEHTHLYQSNSDFPTSYTIVLTATSSAGCIDTTSRVFTLLPGVNAAFTTGPGGCSPYPAVFVNQSQGAVAFAWSFGDGLYSTENNPDHIYTTSNVNDQSFTASLVAENAFGCRDTAIAEITVFHSPVAIAQIDTSFGCYPRTVTFFNGSIGADTYQWVYGTGITSDTSATYHSVTFFNPGINPVTYNVVLHAYTENGCTSQDPLQVQVAPVLDAAFSLNASGCSPLDVAFDNNSDGAWSYLWDFGDGDFSNDAEPEHTFFNWGNSDTTYQVTLIVFNSYGCSDTTDAFVNVLAQPIADFQATPEQQMWPASTIALDNTSMGGALNFEWNFGDGTTVYTSEPGSYTYSNWGEYTIRLIASNGFCSDTTFRSIEILAPPPIANFEGPATGCAPLTVQFTNLSEYAVISQWQFGDGGTANATNPVYTYWQPGTYSVTLTVIGADGTNHTLTREFIIEVYPNAVAAFTVTPNQVNIPSQPVYCLNLSQNATSYVWEFGDGNTSTETNPLHYYTEEGLFDVMLIANNTYNCPDTMLVVGAVHAKSGGLIDFPNAFTPVPSGGSGGIYDPMSFSNDVFFPMHAGVDEYSLQIFNKWGELLFQTTDVYRGWDGYYRGELCKQDVYVWKVRGRFVDGQTFERAGDVTLLIR